MPRLYLRVFGHQDAADSIMTTIESLDFVERVEQVGDLIPQMEDDSSSAGLASDAGMGTHSIEVEVPREAQADLVRKVAEDAALRYEATVEFVHEL